MKQFFAQIMFEWLRFWAKLQLRKYSPDVIGITGSAGKTSTMHAVEAILRDKYVTKMSVKANSASGIPLHILGLELANYSLLSWIKIGLLAPIQFLIVWKPCEKYIIEMGVDGPDYPNNMESLLRIVQPRTGIFLNAAPMHSEPFDHLVSEKEPEKRRKAIVRLIANEKGKLIEGLPAEGLAILNGDQTEISQFTKKTAAQVMTFGVHRESVVQLIGVERSLKGTSFLFSYAGTTEKLHFNQLLLADHFGFSFAAALCVAIDEDFSLKEGIELLSRNFKIPPGRSSLLPGIKGSLIIDSSYNSSAEPLLDMLTMLSELKGGRSLALLGDIRELGVETAYEHELIARAAMTHCDGVFLVGPLMKMHVLPLLEKHSGKDFEVHWFAKASLAAHAIRKMLRPTDVLLVKGSQNELLLEIAVGLLMRRQHEAEKLLCRRGAYWDSRRQALG